MSSSAWAAETTGAVDSTSGSGIGCDESASRPPAKSTSALVRARCCKTWSAAGRIGERVSERRRDEHGWARPAPAAERRVGGGRAGRRELRQARSLRGPARDPGGGGRPRGRAGGGG